MRFEKILNVENLEKIFRGEENPVLTDLSFNLLEGEFLGIMGRSGSGKTTILNSISLVGSFNKGSISYYDKDISLFSKKDIRNYRQDVISSIYQDYKLIDTLTAFENISIPYYIKEKPIQKEEIKNLSKILKIDQILNKPVKKLSGGQAQRVAIARALVKNTKIILADEPTSALDSKTSEIVLKLLKAFNRLYNKSIIMASHDLRAVSFTDRVIFLRDGKIYNELRRKEDEDRRDYLVRIENADRQLIR